MKAPPDTAEAAEAAATPLQPSAASTGVPRWRGRGLRLMVAFASAFAVGYAAVLALVVMWPATAIAVVAAATVAYLAWRAPPYAFVAAALLFAAEGTLKILTSAGEVPIGVAPTTFVAATLDAALVVAILGLVRERRSNRLAVRNVRTGEAIALALLPAWVLLSFVQAFLSPDLERAAGGFRLTQLYVLAAVGGALLLARPTGRGGPLLALLAGFSLVSGYAAIRAAVGPAGPERSYALLTQTTQFAEGVFRSIGSFSGSVGMVSYVAPAAILSLALAALSPRFQLAAAGAAGIGGIAVVSSYVRAGIVALAVGVLVVFVAVLAAPFYGRRQRLALAGAVLAAAAAGAAATAALSTVSPAMERRIEGILRPFDDESMQLRFDTWGAALERIVDQPLGRGLGTVGRASGLGGAETVTTDNAYLKIFIEQGIFGGALFLAAVAGVFLVVLRRLRGASRERWSIAVAGLAAFSSFLVLNLAGEYVEQPGKVVAWAALGLAAWAAFGVHAAPVAPSERVWPRMPSRRLLAGVALLAVVLIAAPLAVSFARTREHEATVTVYFARVPGVRPPSDRIDHFRFLLRSPHVTNNLSGTAGYLLDAQDAVRGAVVARASERLLLTARADTPARAPDLALAMARLVAGGSQLEVHRRAVRLRAQARAHLRRADLDAQARRWLGRRVATLDRVVTAPFSFFALDGRVRVAPPRSAADRWLDALPGPLPPTPDPVLAGVAGFIAALALTALVADASLGVRRPRPRWRESANGPRPR